MNNTIEEKLRHIYDLDHDCCKAELLSFEDAKLDFTSEYLDTLSVERLRHLLAAAYIQAAKRGPRAKRSA